MRDRNVLRYYARIIQHLLPAVTPHARTALMLDATSKVVLPCAGPESRVSRASPRASAWPDPRVSRAASSPARPWKRPSRPPGHPGERPAADARLPGRERHDARRGRSRHGRLPRAHREDPRRGHRPQHLAEADAARPRHRPTVCVDNMPRILERRDAARLLRAHRHGELALHPDDAGHVRRRSGAGVPERRHGAAVGGLPQRGRCQGRVEAGRARAAGEGRLQGTRRRSPTRPRPTWTGVCPHHEDAARRRAPTPPSPRTTRR